jgi:hypothetical protein
MGAVYIFWGARHFAPERARDLGSELADRLREGGFSASGHLRIVPALLVPLDPLQVSVLERARILEAEAESAIDAYVGEPGEGGSGPVSSPR